jgi:hypothetical protein
LAALALNNILKSEGYWARKRREGTAGGELGKKLLRVSICMRL